MPLVALAVGSVVLSGCSPAPEPTPTPTAVFASEEEAYAAAEETYRAYIDAFNAVDLSDPSTFESVLSFTTGDYQSDERKSLSEMHAQGHVRGGAIQVLSFLGEDASDQSEIRARACTDISSTTFTDENGTSLVPPDRPDRIALSLTFVLDEEAVLLSGADRVEDAACESE